jgi:hypothetical protein
MTQDRVDWLVNRHHVACLALLRLEGEENRFCRYV